MELGLRHAAFLLIFIAAVAAMGIAFIGLPADTAHAHEHDPEETEDQGEASYTYTSDVLYWSRVYNDWENRDDWSEEDEEEYAETDFYESMARMQDHTWESPPEEIYEWNHENLFNFRAGTDDVTVHPEGANLEDEGRIEDAYIQIHSINPSTVMHLGTYERSRSGNYDTERKYINHDTELNAIVDYRIDEPEDDPHPEAPPPEWRLDYEYPENEYPSESWGGEINNADDGDQHVERHLRTAGITEAVMEHSDDDQDDREYYDWRQDEDGGISKTINFDPKADSSDGLEEQLGATDYYLYAHAKIETHVEVHTWELDIWCDPCEEDEERKTFTNNIDEFEDGECPWDSCNKIEVVEEAEYWYANNTEYAENASECSLDTCYLWETGDPNNLYYDERERGESASDVSFDNPTLLGEASPQVNKYYDEKTDATRENPTCEDNFNSCDDVEGENVFMKEHGEWYDPTDEDDLEECDSCGVHWENDSLWVIDKSNEPVEVYDFETDVNWTSLPDGRTQLHVNPVGETYWDSIVMPNDERANTGLKYFSMRDKDWDVIETTTDDGTSTMRSEEDAQPLSIWWQEHPTRPAQTHAYPSAEGAFAGLGEESGAWIVHENSFSTRNSPELHENVSVNTPSDTYDNVYEMVYEPTINWEPTGNMQGFGLEGNVYGSEAEINEVNYIETEQPQISVDVDHYEYEEEWARFIVTVEDENGVPIDTSEREDEYIELMDDGQEVNTDSQGQTYITLDTEENDRVYAQYHAEPWWEHGEDDQEPNFVDNREEITIELAHANAYRLLDMVYVTVVPFALLGFLIWLLDHIFPFKLWPPWKHFF